MTEFNFTVRATDNLGAFADRQFSINVRNTVIDRWVASTHGGNIIKSIDGVNWTSQLNVLPSGWGNTNTNLASLGDVIHFAGNWYIMASTGYMISPDAATWSFVQYPTAPGGQATTMGIMNCISESRWTKSETHLAFMAPSSTGSPSSTRMGLYMTEDGVNWTLKWSTTNSDYAQLTRYSRVVYGNGHWVILTNRGISQSVFAIKSSDNGDTWTNISQTGISAFNAANMMFINGKWIIVDVGGNFYISDDLEYWTFKTRPTTPSVFPYTQNLYDWNYGNGVISVFPEINATQTYDVTSNRSVLSSVDLENWTTTALPSAPIVNTAAAPPNTVRVGSATSLTRVSNAFYNGSFVFGVSNRHSSGTAGLYRSTNGNDYTRLTEIPTDVGGQNVLIFGIAATSY